MTQNDTRELGQFIPLHYHYPMLYDKARMSSFCDAVNQVVQPGAVVLELGSGTGVLSFFAAQKAARVYSVELNLDLVEESRRLLALNQCEDKVQVIHADAFEYIPPEPVDVVICEMLHVGLLREKQLAVIDAFKSRYQQSFQGQPLPVFLPKAVIQAFQPVQHDFFFEGFYAPIVMFQYPYSVDPRTTELADPVIYHQLQYEHQFGLTCEWSGTVTVKAQGVLNALRIATKSILALVPEDQSGIFWHNQYLIVPLEEELSVNPGQNIAVSLEYTAGAPLSALDPVVSLL